MATRIAINGYGRIGRSILRAFYEAKASANIDDSSRYEGLEFAVINDLADLGTLTHLTRYDSTHGRFQGDVQSSEESRIKYDRPLLLVNNDEIAISQQPDLSQLPWEEEQIDLVMECSGAFSDRASAQKHIDRGAKRVLFSQPAESDVDATIVWGINHELLIAEDTIVSAASCTTNCIVPVLKALDEAFGVASGIITTIHSAMNDQPVIDSHHNADLRKTRSAMQSIIPVDTALAKGIERILPQFKGKLEAQAIRVPTLNVSAMDLTVTVGQRVNVEAVNLAMTEASDLLPADVMEVTDAPLVSCDYNHDPCSATVDLNQTRVAKGRLVKLLVWFDNEWAFAHRMLDVAKYWSGLPDTKRERGKPTEIYKTEWD